MASGFILCKNARFSTASRYTHAMKHILNWILSALAVWLVARLVPGFHVTGAVAALIAALAIGFINATLGLFLKIVTFPLTLITLGIFWLLINAVMIELASAIVPGFHVDSFGAAFWGAIVLSIVNMLFRWLAGVGKSSSDHA
jgi:putative membrane protein